MSDLTLAVVARALFDADVEGEAAVVGQAMRMVMERFTARMDSALPLPERLPTPGNLRLRHAVRQLDEVIYRVIDQARHHSADQGTHLLGLLLAAQDEDGGRMSNREVRDEAMAFFLAGHETTALALTWTFHLLASIPTSAPGSRRNSRRYLAVARPWSRTCSTWCSPAECCGRHCGCTRRRTHSRATRSPTPTSTGGGSRGTAP
jgi:cytochrome P450